MNRPDKRNDPNYPFEFPDTYLGELEKYCDRLEKAIDKACQELSMLDYEVEMAKSSCSAFDCIHRDAEQWKEILLND